MRALAAVGLVLRGLGAGVSPASADTLGDTTAASQPNGRSADTTVSQTGSTSSSVSVGVSSLDGCTFLPSLAPSEAATVLSDHAVFPAQSIPDDTQRYTMIICPVDGERPLFCEFWPEDGLPSVPVSRFLGRESVARAEVPLPDPQGAPNGVDIAYPVNLSNWWWLDDWNPASGTAALAAPNPVSITAILTPTE